MCSVFWESDSTSTTDIDSSTFDDEAFNTCDTSPENCVDGDITTKCESSETGVTITVETQKREHISGVKTTINEDNQDSLIDATVHVDDQYCGTITEIPPDVSTFIFTCENGVISGTTVTISTADNKVWSLNELEIVTVPDGNQLFYVWVFFYCFRWVNWLKTLCLKQKNVFNSKFLLVSWFTITNTWDNKNNFFFILFQIRMCCKKISL